MTADEFQKIVEDLFWLNLQNLSGREDFQDAFQKGIEVGVEYAEQEKKKAVAEALEKEVVKAWKYGNKYGKENKRIALPKKSKDYYETEVKPKYE